MRRSTVQSHPLQLAFSAFSDNKMSIGVQSKLNYHYGKNRVRLVGFKKTKYFYCSLKLTSLIRILPQGKKQKLQCKQEQSQTSKNTDCLRAPCLLHQYCQWPQQQKKKRKEAAYPWKAGASSGHIKNLKQSILETFDIYGNNGQE